MNLWRQKLALLIVATCCSVIVKAAGRRRKDGVVNSRYVTIQNNSGAKVDIFWIHPKTRELAASNTEGKGVAYGASTGISSYMTHAFEVQEMEPCQSKRCRKGYFTVNANEDQIYTVTKDFSVDVVDNKSRAREQARSALTSSCHIDHSASSGSSPLEKIEKLASCLESQAQATVEAREQEIHFQASARQRMGTDLADYACLDDKLNTTKSLFNDTLVSNGESYLKQVLFFNDNGGLLAMIDNIVSAEESAVLLKAANSEKLTSDEQTKRTVSLEKLSTLMRTSLADGIVLNTLEKKVHLPGYRQGGQESCTSSDSQTCDLRAKRSLSVAVKAGSADAPAASLVVFTETNNALHFPRIGAHIQSVPGRVALLLYGKGDDTDQFGYIGDYKVCFTNDSEQMTLLGADIKV